MTEIIIKYFFCDTPEGKKLIQMTSQCFRELENKLNYKFNFKLQPAKGLNTTPESSAYKLLKSALNNEIVIFDGSLESEVFTDENISDFGSNYECITPAVMSLDNIIVLSRTQIPLNFTPLRTNVKKLENIKDTVNSDNSSKNGYQLKYNNNQIINWLKEEILKMEKSGRLERNPEMALDISSNINTKELLVKEKEIFEENNSFIKNNDKNHKKRCFISYRGCYYNRKKYNNIYDIQKVKEEIEKYHDGNAEIKVLAEGCLSNELMTELRRWAFVCYIDRMIIECDEFWIFETKYREEEGKVKELGYWDSWWCLGEILSILRIKNEILQNKKIKVMIFDPDAEESKRIREADISKWHNISSEEKKELARYYSNSDFLEAGYESVKSMRRMRKWPKFLRKLKFYLVKKIVSSQYTNASKNENFMDDYTFKDFENSVFSHVYDKSFMENRILSCGQCIVKGNDESLVYDKNFIWNFLNINGVYTSDNENIAHPKGYIVLTPKMFNYIMNDENRVNNNIIKSGGAIKCNNKHLSLIYKTDDYFYVWWTPRMGKRTGPNKSIIEVVPLYSSTEIHY